MCFGCRRAAAEPPTCDVSISHFLSAFPCQEGVTTSRVKPLCVGHLPKERIGGIELSERAVTGQLHRVVITQSKRSDKDNPVHRRYRRETVGDHKHGCPGRELPAQVFHHF